ncbi:hypothetical protein QYM36_013412 [Artemia franciscana]|uniref:Uncharacterized protein n=1 Tax=Artemia franciscana TaxID=6661 RepID=A0AA88HQ36_ARTSF|nr:hypothetical protein QYM36_013412 [Artemia franciscana]
MAHLQKEYDGQEDRYEQLFYFRFRVDEYLAFEADKMVLNILVELNYTNDLYNNYEDIERSAKKRNAVQCLHTKEVHLVLSICQNLTLP